MTSGARNSGVPKFTLNFSLGLYLKGRWRTNGRERNSRFMKTGRKKASVNTHTETNTNLLASPKSIIFTLFVCRLTQRMFSGCWHSIHKDFKLLVLFMELFKCILLTRMCLAPLGQGVICTSCACTEALHWSVWWTALCPTRSACSSHLWSGQTALRHQH